ncbi:MAG: hypothetical protein JXA92_08930 [candidate division Zixibacteria bacterium]|nr:hypothetical protein [candidate division Zixibacteria bacterium]
MSQLKRAGKWFGFVLSINLLSIFLFVGCNSGEDVPCRWNAVGVTVDGRFDDWNNMPTTFFKDQNVSLGLANDSVNLYIIFRFTDQQWARIIRMSGISVWVDSEGKKSKDFGIKFNGGPKLDSAQMAQMNNMPNMPESRTMPDRQRETPENQLMVYDKERLVEKIIPVDGREGPQVACEMVQGFYTYEFKIPLQKSVLNYYGVDTQAGEKIGIGFEWGDRPEMKSRPGGGPGGGMGGGPPGGMGGGRPPGGGQGGGPSGGRMQMPEKQEIWLKTNLCLSSATQPESNP